MASRSGSRRRPAARRLAHSRSPTARSKASNARRAALVRRQVAGEIASLQALAQAVGCSRSTVSRFFGGQRTGVAVALQIPRGAGRPLFGELPLEDPVCQVMHLTHGMDRPSLDDHRD
jgi:hypothetical protein